MDLENERVLKLIFPEGLPENLQEKSDELVKYLAKLGTYKVEQLKKEQTRLVEETKSIVEQTQDLAISNYKTFIHTAENSRSIFEEFQNAENQVETLLQKLPAFNGKCDDFLKESVEINEKRRLNSITLKKNAQLLEILELPQLMDRCIREGRYEEALELASYVQKLGQNQGNIPVIKSIVRSVEALWHTMLVQLVAQLRTDLQLPKCLQIVGYLRRMQAFGKNELKLKFLQARDAWLISCLKAVPKDDATQHLTKTIEVTRVNLFNIITQYRAIFPDEEGSSSALTTSKPMDGVICDCDRLFEGWLHDKINHFLKTLEFDLERGVSSFDTLLGQCMYFGLSFSRVGADFRALMAPIFVRIIRRNFEHSISQVNAQFQRELEKYTLINKVTVHSRKTIDNSTSSIPTNEHENFSPPETLLDFHPLAALCNGYLTALNELRLCAPLALATHVTDCLQASLRFVAEEVLHFFRQEQQAFTSNERENFIKLCSCFAYDLIPYIQRCVHAIFPQQTLTSHLGINLIQLEQDKITYFQQDAIIESIKHMLPHRIDFPMRPQTEKLQENIVPVKIES